MNNHASPSPDSDSARNLRVLPSLQPKRRCKTRKISLKAKPASDVIVSFPSQGHKPVRFTRSGQAFQVWKAPKVHQPEPPRQKRDLRAALTETLQSYARSMALLLSWRLHHSP